jgi:hypothetical protein
MRRSSKTFAKLQQRLFKTSDPSTSSAAGSPAKTSAQPGKGRGSKASGRDSGSKWPVSFERYDLAGYWLKMYLLCEAEGLTGCSLTWKRQATPLGRLWWVLGRSARRTNGTGCGLSESWSSPKASVVGHSGPNMRNGDHQPLPAQVLNLWPTVHGNNGNNGPSGTELGNAVNRDWPTIRASVADNGNDSGSRQRLEQGSNPGLKDLVRELNWLTPRSSDEDKAGANPSTATTLGRARLPEAVKQPVWPTPAARDEKNPQASEATLQRNSRPLNGVAYAVGQPDQENSSTPGKPRGSLNSAWVMQLMGWPDEYAAELTRLLCEWSETAGATRSRK